MSNKIEETCKTFDRCNNGYSVDNIQNPSLIHDNQRIFQNEFPGKLVLGNCETIIELKVKEKRHKPARTIVSEQNREQNAKEGQKSNGEHRQNWFQDLQEHTRPFVKQNLQNISSKNQHTKRISSSEPKDNKKLSIQQQLKYRNSSAYKQLDEVPVKQVPMQKISKEYGKKSQQTGISSGASSKCTKCTKSVLVTDREVQCGGIFDSSYDKFSDFNPVRTLGFLMKELECLIKDETSSTILREMEQTLCRIPIPSHTIEPERTKSITMDLEVLSLRTRLDESTAELEKMSKQMKTLCESLREEQNSLKRDVEKYSKLLEEARHKQSDLKKQLNEASKTIESKDKVISELQEQYKKVEPLQDKLAELRIDLTKQTELTRQSRLEVQYLMLERDKLSVLSSHKDSQFNEYRNVIKEFQNEIEHLIDYREDRIREENSNLQGSIMQRGPACSSPSPTSSDRSNIPTSLLDMSISTIEDNKNLKKGASKKDNPLIQAYRTAEKDTAKITMEEINESKNNRDSTQLEFISLPPAESTLFPSYRDQECLDESDTNKDKDYLFPSKSKLPDRVQQFVDADSTKSSVQVITEKDNEKELYKKQLSKGRKTLQFDNNKKKNHDNEGIEESSKFIETNVSGDLITSHINEQFQTIFDEVRRKSRISVNVPSPPRHYPHPDWTDSSLPSVSVDSELNIVQSNIT